MEGYIVFNEVLKYFALYQSFKYFFQMGSSDMARLSFKDSLSFTHSEGNVLLSRQDLKISSKRGKTISPHNFSIHTLICHVRGLY